MTSGVKRVQYNSSVYRLNVSYLSAEVFGAHRSPCKRQRRVRGVCPRLDALKGHVLELLRRHQGHRGLTSWTVAWQTHTSCQRAHLDILLLYDRSIKKRPSSFDYLLQVCPQDVQYFSQSQGRRPQVWITGYPLRRLSAAVLEYGRKEDPDVLSNFPYESSEEYLVLGEIRRDPYAYLSDRMREDPYNFDLAEYVEAYRLDKEVRGWSSVKHKLLDIRAALIARLELQKPGIREITRELVEERLTYEELAVFDTYPCFRVIVDHLNQIPRYGPYRPHKTRNLFVSGPKNVGKTALAECLGRLVGHYNLKYENRYLNRYSNRKYGFIVWNEVKLTDFSPTWILQFLEGVEVPIPMRYNACKKSDNPLVYMTSNLTLDEHLRNRYREDEGMYRCAVENLGARITAVEVPVPMFFLQKLLVPAEERRGEVPQKGQEERGPSIYTAEGL